MTQENDEARVVVCPTSHLDWDWNTTFAGYGQVGQPPGGSQYVASVDDVLTGAANLLTSDASFCFSLAEIGFLRAFAERNPGSLAQLLAVDPERLLLMGGGITSPDNLVCHGEVFVRNYLVGRAWLASVGFSGHVGPVAWLPDDFGHDPQLPIALAAMGLQYLGVSRVPGSPQPFAIQPQDGSPSVAQQLADGGLVFEWVAADGSQVLAHFMPDKYAPLADGTAKWAPFVEGFPDGWPLVGGQPLWLAPAGGDFVRAQWAGGDWVAFLQANPAPAGFTTEIGTFITFMAQAAPAAGATQAPLLAQNFYTGYFASRPRLKVLHHRAARLALAAEAISTLLRVASVCSSSTLDALDAAIWQAWEALVPSSHHDFVTGTSPDDVYLSEQLPLLELASELAESCLTAAVQRAAAWIAPGTASADEVAIAVFNPLGFARAGIAELPSAAAPRGVRAVTSGTTELPVQRLADGGLLFAVPELPSFGYDTVSLQRGPDPAPPAAPAAAGVVTLDNGIVSATIDRAQAWAITALTVAGQPLLPAGGHGNSIRVYNDSGNLYQFGNEPQYCPADFETFSDLNVAFEGQPGRWLEHGPVRWHFRAAITDAITGDFTLDYVLCAGADVLEVRLTGAAPAGGAAPSGTTVVSAFDLPAPVDGLPPTIAHGSAQHYNDRLANPCWPAPTFNATHDFILTAGGHGLAVFHAGVPAWAIEDGRLLGALLRNTPGGQRAAEGNDPAVHTQTFWLGAGSPPTSGRPLRTAQSASTQLIAAPTSGAQIAGTGVSLPATASLVRVTSGSPAIVRAARTQPGETITKQFAERVSFVVRVYAPDATAAGAAPVTLTFPSLSAQPDLGAVAVTALEEPAAGPAVTVAGNTVSFTPAAALTTLQVTVTRPTLDSGS